MKKKYVKVLAMTLMLAVLPVATYAASGSPQNSGSNTSSASSGSAGSGWYGGSGSSGTSITQPTAPSVTVTANGSQVSVGQSSKDTSGVTMGLVVDTTTAAGQQVTMQGGGKAVIGDMTVHFAAGSAETAGLPDGVVSTINDLNDGKEVTAVFAGRDLDGYQKLGNTRALILTSKVTGKAETAETEVSLVVNEMNPGTTSMVVMYYDNATGRWARKVISFNVGAKTVTFTVPGSCTVQLLWK